MSGCQLAAGTARFTCEARRKAGFVLGPGSNEWSRVRIR